MLKWCKVLLGRKFSELLYLSDERILQTNFPASSGKAARLKEKHAKLSKQENTHDKLSLTTRLARAVMFKKENLCCLRLTNSNLWAIPLRLTATVVSSAEVSERQENTYWLSSKKNIKRKKIARCDDILCKWQKKMYILPLPVYASKSKIKRRNRFQLTRNSNIFMLRIVFKTAPSFSRSLAKSSKTSEEVKLQTFLQVKSMLNINDVR